LDRHSSSERRLNIGQIRLIFKQYFFLEGFKPTVSKSPEAAMEGLDANTLTAQDMRLLILHQANRRIGEAVAQRWGFGTTRFTSTFRATETPRGIDSHRV